MDWLTALVRSRALARAASVGGSLTNGDATRAVVPFTEWLLHVHGVENWQTLKRYALWNHYLDYRSDCVRHGMMFQSGECYGLTNV